MVCDEKCLGACGKIRHDRILRYITVRVDEDRRRAEKLKDRRARKAAKRPAGSHSRRSAAMEFSDASNE
jgi:hypothetical protein